MNKKITYNNRINELTYQRDELLKIVQQFMACQAADGTKCAANDDTFAAAAMVLRDLGLADTGKREP